MFIALVPANRYRWQAGVTLTAAQQAVAESYADMAEGQAWNFAVKSGGRMSVDDARSAALLGVVQAVDSWPRYLERHPEFDPGRVDYRRAYVLKRIKGAILDLARSQDHLPRSARVRVKILRQIEDDGIRDDAGKAAAAGLSVARVRQLEADALMPVSLQDQSCLDGGEYAGRWMTDHTADVESQAVVSSILSSFMAAFDSLDPETQVVLAFRYHAELEFADIAGLLFTDPKRVAGLHDAAVLTLHAALIAQVSS